MISDVGCCLSLDVESRRCQCAGGGVRIGRNGDPSDAEEASISLIILSDGCCIRDVCWCTRETQLGVTRRLIRALTDAFMYVKLSRLKVLCTREGTEYKLESKKNQTTPVAKPHHPINLFTKSSICVSRPMT